MFYTLIITLYLNYNHFKDLCLNSLIILILVDEVKFVTNYVFQVANILYMHTHTYTGWQNTES